MKLNRNRLYILLITACLTGYFWLYVNSTNNLIKHTSTEVCLIKNVTGIPCPSCGSTRSVMAITYGNFSDALNLNPFGFVIALIMLIIPIWIILDIIKKNDSLYSFYLKFETYLKKPIYAVSLILLVLLNWIWNITKGL